MAKKDEEFEKQAVECHGDHSNLEREMVKTGSEVATCPYCGKTINKPKTKKEDE